MSYYIITKSYLADDKLIHCVKGLDVTYEEITETEAILLLQGGFRKCRGVYCDGTWKAQEKDTAAQAQRESK
jgi:hypothetical protein